MLLQLSTFDESKFLYGIIYNLKKVIDEEKSKVFELRKDAEESDREKVALRLEVLNLSDKVAVSFIKYFLSLLNFKFKTLLDQVLSLI